MLSRSQVNNRIARTTLAAREERLRSPQIIQQGRAIRHSKNNPIIFRIAALTSYSSVYTCREQIVDSTYWSNSTGTSKLVDLNSTDIQVFNLAENAIAECGLEVNDLLIAWQMTDDGGIGRWIGFPAKFAWWHS